MKSFTDKDRLVRRLRINLQSGLAGLIMILMLSSMGCQDVLPTNPYDPKTPEMIQAKGSFSVQVESTIEEYDWSKAIAEISSLDSAEIDTHSIDAAGMLVIGDLLANTYRLVIIAPGHIDHVELINVRAGQERVGFPVTLLLKKESEDESVFLTGILDLNDRNDESGVQVRAFIGQQQQASDLSASNGTFSLRLSPLDHTLTLSANGYISKTLDVQWSEARARFETVIDGESVTVDEAQIIIEIDDGPTGDRDSDGVINSEDNCIEHVNPDQLNTDGDALGDLCDLDDDDDGLSDLIELQLGTSTTDSDSDADGLDDLTEHSVIGSSPTLADTDGDGERDGDEVGADSSSPLDFDGDGIPDVLESSIRDSDLDGAMDEVDGPGPNGDLDGDDVINSADNCPAVNSLDLTDTDGDGAGDACDPDDDDDDFEDAQDNCPRDANAEQTDNDGDGVGDACDSDDDGDGLTDDVDSFPLLVDFDRDGVLDGDGDQAVDNCPAVPNPDQRDNDGDGDGDACDTDDDDDTVEDLIDNCPLVPNLDQLNSEPTPDSLGDACDLDDDNDGVLDTRDNCHFAINPTQADKDFDGDGNECDDDDDGDGVLDVDDNCPLVSNAGQQDSDGDGVGNACSQDIDGDGIADGRDNCPNDQNEDQRNRDGDQFGDACDPDIDGDGFVNVEDNCVTIYNDPQLDLDGDLLGDACDLDDDGDGVEDRFDSCPRVVNDGRDDEPLGEEDNIDSACDNCPLDNNEYQIDRDGDGDGDACDDDIDGDGFSNEVDNCPRIVNPEQVDTSGDGVGDACENNVTYYLSDHFPVSDTALWKSPTSPTGDIFWVALDGGGLVEHVREADGSWTRVKQHTPTDGLPDRWIKHLAVDNAGTLYVITRMGLGVRYAASEVWENEEYRTDIASDDCATAWGYANGIDVGNFLMWKYADDLDVDKVTGAVYAVFTGNPEYPDVLIKSDSGALTCWPRGTGALDAEFYSVDVSPDGEQVWVGHALGASRYIESEGWTSFLDAQLRFSTARQVGFELNGSEYDAVVMNSAALEPAVGNITGARVLIDGSVSETNMNLNASSYEYTESTLGAIGVELNGAFSAESTIGATQWRVFKAQASDTVWLQAKGGGSLFVVNEDGSLSESIEESQGRTVMGLAVERDDSYWLATTSGLYSSAADFTYTTASGLHTNDLTSVSVDQGGIVWIGTPSGLARLQVGQFDRLSEVKVFGVAVDSNNGVWVAQEDGLFEFDGVGLVEVTDGTGTPLCEAGWHYRDGVPYPQAISIDQGGAVWVSCRHRIYRRIGAVWSQYADFGVESLDFFSTGDVWAGGGVGIFADGGVRVRRDVGGHAFAMRGTGREGWTAIYGGLAVSEGIEGGTDGLEVGGRYVPQPCADSKSGCPRLGWVPIEGGTYDFSRGVEVTLIDFEMMRTEVTYEMIRGCVEDDVCSSNNGVYYGSQIRKEMGHPIAYTSWFALQVFAEWVGARLATESEWEYAARSQGRDIEYPWGDTEPDCAYADFRFNNEYCRGEGTSKVCLTPLGDTEQGLCDLGGNIREWVQDHYNSQIAEIPLDGAGACTDARGCPINTSDDTNRILRGGSWNFHATDLHITSVSFDTPLAQSTDNGGRLVR